MKFASMRARLASVAVVAGAALLLTIATEEVTLAQTPAPRNRQLSAQQQTLVNAKEQVRAQAGIAAKPSPQSRFVQPGQPVRRSTGRIETTKAKLLAELAAAEAAEQTNLAQPERLGGRGPGASEAR